MRSPSFHRRPLILSFDKHASPTSLEPAEILCLSDTTRSGWWPGGHQGPHRHSSGLLWTLWKRPV